MNELTLLLLWWFEEIPHILQFRSNYQKGEKRIGLKCLSPWVPECLLKCPLMGQGENTKPVKKLNAWLIHKPKLINKRQWSFRSELNSLSQK